MHPYDIAIARAVYSIVIFIISEKFSLVYSYQIPKRLVLTFTSLWWHSLGCRKRPLRKPGWYPNAAANPL
jgi:hypothetical protein